MLFVEGSTHFGSIISFSHASSELSFTADMRVLARILAKAGLDLAGTNAGWGSEAEKPLRETGGCGWLWRYLTSWWEGVLHLE